MNVKYVTVPKCVDCQKDCEKADYVFFGESKVCKHGKGFIICGIAPEKRKPLMSDGTLPLTNGEMSEFIYLFYPNTKTLKISASGCFILSNAERNIINNYKAILWLAEQFDLNEVKL